MKVCGGEESFVVLGGNISDEYEQYNDKQTKRNKAFFKNINKVPIHSQVFFTLMRLCGGPRNKFYCSVTPPKYSKEVATEFQQTMIRLLEDKLDFKIPQQALHERLGVGIPDYVSNINQLYNASKGLVLMSPSLSGEGPARVSLVTCFSSSKDSSLDESWTAHFAAQSQAEWMFHSTFGSYQNMSSHHFTIALALRCRTMTTTQKNRITTMVCNQCNETFTNPIEVSHHHVSCTSSRFTVTNRHTQVKHIF